MLLLGLMSACRSARIGYSGASLISPIESGVTDSFFPDGPTAGYLLRDDLTSVVISPSKGFQTTELLPEVGLHADPQRLPDAQTTPSSPYGQSISLLDGNKVVQSSDHVQILSSSNGDASVRAWIEGNPKATMYRISTLERVFPSNADTPLTIQLKRLSSTRYAWRCQGWFMSHAMYFSFDGGRTWRQDYSPPQKAFEINPKQKVSGNPVLLDIRVAEPGRYWFARYQLP
ncbi:MAG TPA: hypothetical protein VFF77_04610 [Holophagaceae bacterium]|nr:hypothetical protein [Holophagaceae bacterium]